MRAKPVTSPITFASSREMCRTVSWFGSSRADTSLQNRSNAAAYPASLWTDSSSSREPPRASRPTRASSSVPVSASTWRQASAATAVAPTSWAHRARCRQRRSSMGVSATALWKCSSAAALRSSGKRAIPTWVWNSGSSAAASAFNQASTAPARSPTSARARASRSHPAASLGAMRARASMCRMAPALSPSLPDRLARRSCASESDSLTFSTRRHALSASRSRPSSSNSRARLRQGLDRSPDSSA